MGEEDVQLKNLYLEEETRKAKERMEEETQELQEKKMDEMFRKMMLDGDIEKEQLIQQLEEAARLRGTKKKKRGMMGMGMM